MGKKILIIIGSLCVVAALSFIALRLINPALFSVVNTAVFPPSDAHPLPDEMAEPEENPLPPNKPPVSPEVNEPPINNSENTISYPDTATLAMDDSNFRVVDEVKYVRIRALAQALNYSVGVSEGANCYINNLENEHWQWSNIGNKAVSAQTQKDSEADCIYIQGEDCGYILWADDLEMLIAYSEYVTSGLFYMPRLFNDDMWVSLDDARRLFECNITEDGTANALILKKTISMHRKFEALIRSHGYEVPEHFGYQFLAFDRGLGARDGLCYILDLDGKPICPQGFVAINFSDRSKTFTVETSDGKHGVVNLNGSFVIEPVFSYIFEYSYLPLFIVQQQAGEKQFEGLYTFDGKELCPTIYEHMGATSAVDYMDGYYDDYHWPLFDSVRLGVKKDSKWGFIDLEGNVILPAEYDMLGQVIVSDDGRSTSFRAYTDEECTALIVIKNGMYGAVDKDGKLVIPFRPEPFE